MPMNSGHQPYKQNIADLPHIFSGQLGGASPLTPEGWQQVLSNEALYERAVNHVGKLIPEENEREVYAQIASNNMADERRIARGGYSFEGLEASSINSNFLGALGPTNLHTIVGFMARTRILDAVQMIKHDMPTFNMKFNIAGFTKGEDSDKVYPLVDSVADGSIAELGKYSLLEPQPGPETPHVEEVTVGGGERVMITNGTKGNLLKEAGRDPRKFNIARNIALGQILIVDGTEKVLAPLYIPALEGVGRAEQRQFSSDVDVEYTLADGTQKSINVNVTGRIDLDHGGYVMHILGGGETVDITHWEFENARLENPANEYDTIRPVNRTETTQLSVEGRPRIAVPFIQEVLEDFNAYGDVDYVTAMVNIASEGIQGIREIEFENKIDEVDQRFDRLKLYDKLRGYGRKISSHNLAAGGMSSAPDPYAWVRNSLKEKVRIMVNDMETQLYIPSEIEHELFLYGAQKDVEWLFDTDYTHHTTEQNEARSTRYGFRIKGVVGYTDHFGRRVKIIGNSYKRMINRPIVGLVKTNDLTAPFGVYYPFSFRVIPGRDPNMPMVDSLLVHQRDVIDFLASAQFRIKLNNNTDGLYEKLTGTEE